MRRRNQALLVAALFALTSPIIGCSESVEEGQTSDFSAFLEDTTDFQREILIDGEVTEAEYESAVLANRECVVSAGYTPEQPVWTYGEFDFVVNVDFSEEEDPEAADKLFLAAIDRCKNEYVSQVARAWASQLIPSDKEREALRPGLLTCLSNTGLDLPESPDDEELFDQLTAALENPVASPDADAIRGCIDEYYQYFLAPAD